MTVPLSSLRLLRVPAARLACPLVVFQLLLSTLRGPMLEPPVKPWLVLFSEKLMLMLAAEMVADEQIRARRACFGFIGLIYGLVCYESTEFSEFVCKVIVAWWQVESWGCWMSGRVREYFM